MNVSGSLIEGQWRPYILLWLLEGLKRYNECGFRAIPRACAQWRDSLVEGQGTVTPRLQDNVIDCIGWHVTKSQLRERFRRDVPAERVRKTKLGEAVFFEKLKERLGSTEDRGFFERKVIEGKGRLRNVWIDKALDKEGQ